MSWPQKSSFSKTCDQHNVAARLAAGKECRLAVTSQIKVEDLTAGEVC
jgi:hypothetical protein